MLGNGAKYKGASISDQPSPARPLVDSAAIRPSPAPTPPTPRLCGPGSARPGAGRRQDRDLHRGAYDRVAKSAEVKRAGGVGDDPGQPDAGQPRRRLPLGADRSTSTTSPARRSRRTPRTAGATAAFVLGDTTGGAPPRSRRSPASPRAARPSPTAPTSSSPTSRPPASACWPRWRPPSERRPQLRPLLRAPRCRARTSPVSPPSS